MRILLLIGLSLISVFDVAAQRDTDIFILDLNLNSPLPEVSNPINITNRFGNDRDPIFDSSGKNIIYSRKSYLGESDIYSYNLKRRQHTQLTFTQERESKPQYSFDGRSLSVIVEDSQGDSHLAQLPLEGGNAQSVLDLIDDVTGYTWCGEYLAAVYSESASKMHIANVLTNGTEITQVGLFSQHFQYIPFDNSLYFIDKTTSSRVIKKLYLDDKRIQPVLNVVEDCEQFIILSDGSILSSDGKVIYYKTNDNDNWQFVVNSEEFGVDRFNYMAISPDEKMLVLVAVINQ